MTLSDWMAQQERNPAWLSRKLGVSHAAARRYIAGERIPRPEIMTKIEELTAGAVGPADFYPASRASEAA